MDGVKWVKGKVLGRGSYGTVSLASPAVVDTTLSLSTQVSYVAVKSAFMEHSSSLVEEGKFLYELRGCPEIVRCFGDDVSIENGKEVYNLLLEYAPGGTLADLIDARRAHNILPKESQVSWYANMLLMGLGHIHEEGYVHCDLKPANILVFPTVTGAGTILNHLKIADFGLAKKAGFCANGSIVKGPLYQLRGTPNYSSPESVMMGQHEAPMDIWSLGCIVVEMFTGRKAYWDVRGRDYVLTQIATNKDLPEIPHGISQEAKDFLTRCLIKDPRERWTADKLLKHPFIVDNSKKLQFERYRAVMVLDNPIGRTLWWSGQSLFSTPTPPFRYAPHQFRLENQDAAAELRI